MEANTSINRLRELQGSGYEIADGQPDIIGWTIKDNNNYRIGVVDDLLFDPEEHKVRYIIANLKNNEFDLDKRKVLLPIGIAELHETNDDVIISAIAPWQVRALPTYGTRMNEYDERDIYTIFSAGSGATLQQNDRQWQKPKNFYEHPTFNQDNLFRKRRKSDQLDTPIERKFRKREGFVPTTTTDYRERAASNPEADRTERPTYEPEAAMVRNDITDTSRSDDRRHTTGMENERVLSRIRKMHDELNEIERDLRSQD